MILLDLSLLDLSLMDFGLLGFRGIVVVAAVGRFGSLSVIVIGLLFWGVLDFAAGRA